jgi:hypothetical protein
MTQRALSRALIFVATQSGPCFLANVSVFFLILPMLFLSDFKSLWVRGLVAFWIWLALGYLAAWSMDRMRGGVWGSVWAFSKHWLKVLALKQAAFGLGVMAALAITLVGVRFYSVVLNAPIAAKIVLFCMSLSFGFWVILAALMGFGYTTEEDLGFKDLVKLAFIAPLAYLPSALLAGVMVIYLSGGMGFLAMQVAPHASRWWFFPLLLPFAFLPAFSLVLLTAFVSLLVEEMRLDSLGYPAPLIRFPSVREIFMPWEY